MLSSLEEYKCVPEEVFLRSGWSKGLRINPHHILGRVLNLVIHLQPGISYPRFGLVFPD